MTKSNIKGNKLKDFCCLVSVILLLFTSLFNLHSFSILYSLLLHLLYFPLLFCCLLLSIFHYSPLLLSSVLLSPQLSSAFIFFPLLYQTFLSSIISSVESVRHSAAVPTTVLQNVVPRAHSKPHYRTPGFPHMAPDPAPSSALILSRAPSTYTWYKLPFLI